MSAATPVGILRPRPVARELRELAGWLPVAASPPALDITGITLDSRRVVAGDLYVGLPGANVHGAVFAEQAAASGAVAILTDPDGAVLSEVSGLPAVVVDNPRQILGRVSAWVYGNPADDLAMIGITGTDGKTTTAMLLESALQAAGYTTGLIGTVMIRIGDQQLHATRTTPEAPDLHALLAVMRERGVAAVAMEVSSHALVLGRVDGVRFDVGVFTNLGHDHLDFHPDLDAYFAAKASLFAPGRCELAVVNVDDAHGRRLACDLESNVQTYATADAAAADWTVQDAHPAGVGWQFQVHGPGVEVEGSTGLPGFFNVSNALAAIAAASAVGADPARAAAGIAATEGVPGRMQPVRAGQEFSVIVDYAHTPDAVERALSVGREIADRQGGKLRVALGCGGDRDPAKRPRMGAIAARLADEVLITDDNPRSEDPAAIRAQMLAGARSDPNARARVFEIGEREEALTTLVRSAAAPDVVMVLGKGHETGQEIAGTVHPFDDRDKLAVAIRNLLAGGVQ